MVRGVCAGIAQYLDVPVKLVRILVVLSIFFGLAFFTLVVYIILAFVLDPMPDNLAAGEQQPSSGELLDIVDKELAAGRNAYVKWSGMSPRIRLPCVAVSVSCKSLKRAEMNNRWQRAGQKVKPGMKIAGKLVLLTALRYGPAGVAGWAVKSVARRP